MRIAYLTTDEVNRTLAVAYGKRYCLTVVPLEPRDGAPDDSFDGVLYDWDYLPPELIRYGPSAGPLPRHVAVHGYNLTHRVKAALRRHGVAVFRRLDAAIFKMLLRRTALTSAGVEDRLEARPA
jgi:hypothetical protein